MSQPIRILRSELTGHIYAVTRYTEAADGMIISDEKEDVTEEVTALMTALTAENQLKELKLLEALLEALVPQYRTVPAESYPSPIEAFSAGRNWMIDHLREIVQKYR